MGFRNFRPCPSGARSIDAMRRTQTCRGADDIQRGQIASAVSAATSTVAAQMGQAAANVSGRGGQRDSGRCRPVDEGPSQLAPSPVDAPTPPVDTFV
jgi:hypothetical protein